MNTICKSIKNIIYIKSYCLSIIYISTPGLAAAGGLGALAVASSVLADGGGGGGGASGGYGYSAPAREGHSGVQHLCHSMSDDRNELMFNHL